MAIPIYKQVHLKSEQKDMILEQIKIHKFGDTPYLFILSHLQNQEIALKELETCIDELNIPNWPYPIFVISDIVGYQGKLEVFHDIQHCPAFFNKKLKSLNVKEQQVMQKLSLKQKNIQNLKSNEYHPPLNRYAKAHKAIFKIVKEAQYLEDLLQKLGSKK